jgi:hypothetical protein
LAKVDEAAETRGIAAAAAWRVHHRPLLPH